MDEESKKIIAGLCESVKTMAMQAEIQTLKNTQESEATLTHKPARKTAT